jgi:hypothetical protein
VEYPEVRHRSDRHVGAKNKGHVEQIHKSAFVGLRMNDKFTLMHIMEHIKFMVFRNKNHMSGIKNRTLKVKVVS